MKRLTKYFITGLLVVLPLFISIYILVIMFRFVDGMLGSFVNVFIKNTFGFHIPGVGLILFVLIVLSVGFLSSLFAVRLLQRKLDKMIGKFPLLRYIYPPIKQIFEFLFSKDNAFKKSVLVQYPFKGNWTLGFVTNETFQEANTKTGVKLLNIFVPMAPNPATGFILFVPKDEVIFLDINVKEAVKLIISGGLLNPTEASKDIEFKK